MTIASSLRPLARTERRLVEALVNQQFWCWGQDIRRPEGNLLLAFGFARTRPPAGVLGSSCYRLRWGEREIVLWGWGLLLAGPAGGVFLPRQGGAPRSALGPLGAPCWSPDGLPPLSEIAVPGLGQWFHDAAEWIAEYETWVLARAGLGYRRACAAGAPRAIFGLFPERVPALWRCIGERMARCLP